MNVEHLGPANLGPLAIFEHEGGKLFIVIFIGLNCSELIA